MERGTIEILMIFWMALIAIGELYGQGGRCNDIEPFCAGERELVFSNSNDVNGGISFAEEGPDYGCLVTQPFPAWFFLQVENSFEF